MSGPLRAAADLRLLRAGVFSAVCVALAAFGHMSASGAGIAWWALGAAWAAVMLVAVPLAGRERRLPGITALLVGGQFALHLLFCLGQPSMPTDGSASASGVLTAARRLLCGDAASAHLTNAMAEQVLRAAGLNPPVFATPAGAMSDMPGMGDMAGHGATAMASGLMLTPSMVAAHVVAGLVMGWVLRRGESALWRTADLTAHAAGRLAAALPLAVFVGVLETLATVTAVLADRSRRGLPAWDDIPPPLSGRYVAHAQGRRGPPVGAAAA